MCMVSQKGRARCKWARATGSCRTRGLALVDGRKTWQAGLALEKEDQQLGTHARKERHAGRCWALAYWADEWLVWAESCGLQSGLALQLLGPKNGPNIGLKFGLLGLRKETNKNTNTINMRNTGQ